MKKNKMMRLASGLLVAVLLTTSMISGTFAKYVTTESGSDSTRVAKWDIDFTEEDKKNADVHYDGVINAADAVKLAQYIAKWDIVLGPSGNVGGDDTTGGDNISGGDIEVGAGDIFG